MENFEVSPSLQKYCKDHEKQKGWRTTKRAILVTDLKGRIVYANPAGLDLVAVREISALRGEKLSDILKLRGSRDPVDLALKNKSICKGDYEINPRGAIKFDAHVEATCIWAKGREGVKVTITIERSQAPETKEPTPMHMYM